MALTRDQILSIRATLPREAVDVPGLGGSVFVRVLTLREVGEIQREQRDAADPMRLYPKLVAMACVGEDGSPLFVGEDVKLVEELPWPAVDAIARAVLRISRMGPEDATPPKA
ncbi:MAG: hypothetical protein U0790_25275 [Isosphaeraceae bacterium]